MPHFDDTSVDAEIAAALARGRDEDWKSLWNAVDDLVEEATFANWTGADVVGTTIVDGEERPIHQVPYPVYAASVERVRECVGALGLIVPFDWMNWDGVIRYQQNPTALATAPVGDAVRLLTAIQRAERFGDGNIEGALNSGLMQAALARLRTWYQDRVV
ncbi:MAG: DUF6508 domain-containing protein [Acidimicrobiia bacterium]